MKIQKILTICMILLFLFTIACKAPKKEPTPTEPNPPNPQTEVETEPSPDPFEPKPKIPETEGVIYTIEIPYYQVEYTKETMKVTDIIVNEGNDKTIITTLPNGVFEMHLLHQLEDIPILLGGSSGTSPENKRLIEQEAKWQLNLFDKKFFSTGDVVLISTGKRGENVNVQDVIKKPAKHSKEVRSKGSETIPAGIKDTSSLLELQKKGSPQPTNWKPEVVCVEGFIPNTVTLDNPNINLKKDSLKIIIKNIMNKEVNLGSKTTSLNAKIPPGETFEKIIPLSDFKQMETIEIKGEEEKVIKSDSIYQFTIVNQENQQTLTYNINTGGLK